MSILLNNISKIYNSVTALSNINLEIKDGMTTVLIGPSGCGKSTLIRIIIGLVKADKGKVIINNQDLSETDIIKLRLKMGYVIQDGGLFPHLTAKENISLVAKHIKWEKNKIDKRISELINLTKFPEEGINKYPAELSGGQQQRVSLMRALMLDPKILLLDEPLGALDPLIRYDLQTDLNEIFSNLKKTVVMVTHDLSEAAFFADKIILMKNGKIIQAGLMEDFIKNPADQFITDFIKAQRPLEIYREQK